MQIQLSGQLLDVLCALKAKQKSLIAESHIGLESDWYQSLQKYFYGLPEHLTVGLGLKRNLQCFRAIVMFEIPALWMDIDQSQYAEHEFTY